MPKNPSVPAPSVPAPTFALPVPADADVLGAVMLLSAPAKDRRIGDRRPTSTEVRAAREVVGLAYFAVQAKAPAPFAGWTFRTSDGLAIPAVRGLAILAGFADARIGRVTGRG